MSSVPRNDLRLGCFVLACVVFAFGIFLGVTGIQDASHHGRNEWGDPVETAMLFDYAIAIILGIAVFFQKGWRLRFVVIVMVIVVLQMPYLTKRAGARYSVRRTRELDAQFYGTPSQTSLAFQVDLDWLAPLGKGQDNAAMWFRDFAEPGGARRQEWREAAPRLMVVSAPGVTSRVLPPADPLLLEAERWTDQGECRFYPNFIRARGQITEVPNFDMITALANSWIARGMHDKSFDDLQRAMRVGRLLRQDDVTILQDLVSVALVQSSAKAMLEMANTRRDTVRSGVVSRVLAECLDIQKETINRRNLLERRMSPGKGVSAADEKNDVDALVTMAEKSADRRFRLGAMGELYVVLNTAKAESKQKAAAVLKLLEQDPDPLVSANAKWYDTVTWNPDDWATIKIQ